MNAIIKAYTLSECMEAMAEQVERYEKAGGVNLVFCEDRLTLIAERAVVRRLGGTFSTSVSTFTRFLKADAKTVTKQGSVMMVGEVMTALQREEKLQCFKTLSGVGNNARCIYETLAQFSASAITPSTLKRVSEELPEDTLKRKVCDLALIYEGYKSALKEKAYLDESEYLSLLPARIRKEGLLKGVNVFFLCYTSFTKQAQELIRAVLETADNVVGVFCAGEEDLYTNGAVETFARVCEEYQPPKILDFGQALDGVAEVVRKCLFNPESAEKRTVTDKIHIFEAEDKTDEAEYVATKIRRLVQQKGVRYRDVAVLTPDVSAYSLALKKAFSEYKIPYFIDEKRSLKSHPLCRFLLDCFRVVKEKYSSSSVQSLTQNFFFGESDEYRNYLLKYANYRFGAKRNIKTDEAVLSAYRLDALESGRERFLKATGRIKAEGLGREYCNIVRKILEDFDAEKKLEELEESAFDLAQKGYLEQIGKALDAVLLEAEALTGDKTLSAAEFSAILEDGLSATEISLIPLKADAVFVGDITDSRIEKVHALFAMGMTDDVPKTAVDTAMISDVEIRRLGEVQAKLEPTVEEVNRRARECVGLNLCTFLDGLYLSYPLKADGDEPAISEIFSYLKDAFLGADGGELKKRKTLSIGDFAYACSAPTPAVRNLLTEKNNFEKKRTNEKKKYSSLHVALERLGKWQDDGEINEDGGQVSIERGEELFFRDGKTSPTSLEGYFTCPFKNFAQRGLGLKERDETTVLSVDTGNFVHDLLENVTPMVEKFATEDEMRAYALEKGTELLKKSAYAMQQDVDSGVYFADSLVKEGAEIAVAMFRQVKNSDFKIEKVEERVDGGFFHGKVDRMDGTDKFVRVVDYKTGRIDDTANSYYVGKKIQLQLYASALKGERAPVGVLYFPAVVDYGEGDYRERFRMQGFLSGDEDALRAGDKSITEEKTSEFFPASLKPSASTKRVMDGETFRDFLDYSVLVARGGEREMKEGFIAPSPYDGACAYCKFGGMCGFDKELCLPRKEKTIDPKTIAEIAKEKRDGEK